MLDHVSLGSRNLQNTVAFYSACFAPLGYNIQHSTPEEVAFGEEGCRTFWLYPVESEQSLSSPRSHIAIQAGSRERVHQFFEAALEHNIEVVRQPGFRPDISPAYFGAVVRDPDGHMIEVVYWSE